LATRKEKVRIHVRKRRAQGGGNEKCALRGRDSDFCVLSINKESNRGFYSRGAARKGKVFIFGKRTMTKVNGPQSFIFRFVPGKEKKAQKERGEGNRY